MRVLYACICLSECAKIFPGNLMTTEYTTSVEQRISLGPSPQLVTPMDGSGCLLIDSKETAPTGTKGNQQPVHYSWLASTLMFNELIDQVDHDQP